MGCFEVYSHPCSIPQYCHSLMLIPINTLFKSMIPNNHRRHGVLSTGLVHIMSDLLMLLQFCFCHLRSPSVGRISPHIFIWLVVFHPTPLKNDGVSNSWDDEIPNMMGKSFKIPWFQSPPTSNPLLFQLLAID